MKVPTATEHKPAGIRPTKALQLLHQAIGSGERPTDFVEALIAAGFAEKQEEAVRARLGSHHSELNQRTRGQTSSPRNAAHARSEVLARVESDLKHFRLRARNK